MISLSFNSLLMQCVFIKMSRYSHRPGGCYGFGYALVVAINSSFFF